MAKKTPEPTFIVRFVAPGLSPDKIPLRSVSEALSAVQDLASGRDPLETSQVPPEKVIGLINVRRGSALYSCISRAPQEARRNLRLVGRILSSLDKDTGENSGLVRALKPIERLSDVAKTIDCRLEVALASRPKSPLFTVEKGDFARLSSRLLLSGDTTIIGTVKRVGGQTGVRCALSVPGRHKLLYCNVETKAVARRLGRHLYEEIAASGSAVWIHQSWHIYKFTIRDFEQPRLGNPKKAIEKLRGAGLNAWDKVGDPDAIIRELRK